MQGLPITMLRDSASTISCLDFPEWGEGTMRTAIIGGGIAGLAAAYELEKARAAGAEIEYTLFESRARLGGSLSSEIVNGAVLEYGPDSFLSARSLQRRSFAASWDWPISSRLRTTPSARPLLWCAIGWYRCPTG